MQELIGDCLSVLGPANGLSQPNDAAYLELSSGERLAFTPDSFVV